MKVIVCCENNNGMMFNNRPANKSQAIKSKKLKKLWM